MVKALRDRLVELAAQGLSDAQIGARVGIHARTVLRYRRRWSIASNWQPSAPAHGTNACYAAGCDRTECRAAGAAYQREHRTRTQYLSRDAPRYGLPWTPDEDAALQELGAVTASRSLARTYAGCQRRLDRLRRNS